MNQHAITLIKMIHIILIGCVVIIPWLNNTMLSSMYFISIPFLLLHWVTNNDTCVLSIMERIIRGLDSKDDCFICNVLEPVFKINHLPVAEVIYVITIALWLYVSYNLYYNNEEIWKIIHDIKKLVLKNSN